jgi:hypothetical protein
MPAEDIVEEGGAGAGTVGPAVAACWGRGVGEELRLLLLLLVPPLRLFLDRSVRARTGGGVGRSLSAVPNGPPARAEASEARVELNAEEPMTPPAAAGDMGAAPPPPLMPPENAERARCGGWYWEGGCCCCCCCWCCCWDDGDACCKLEVGNERERACCGDADGDAAGLLRDPPPRAPLPLPLLLLLLPAPPPPNDAGEPLRLAHCARGGAALRSAGSSDDSEECTTLRTRCVLARCVPPFDEPRVAINIRAVRPPDVGVNAPEEGEGPRVGDEDGDDVDVAPPPLDDDDSGNNALRIFVGNEPSNTEPLSGVEFIAPYFDELVGPSFSARPTATMSQVPVPEAGRVPRSKTCVRA